MSFNQLLSRLMSSQMLQRDGQLFEQEAYAGFIAMKDFEYLLQGKAFIFQTDHNNLKWMEAYSGSKNNSMENLYAEFQFSY